MRKTMFQPLVVLATVAVLGLTVFAARPSAQGTVALEAGPTPMEANCASRLDGCLFRLDGHKFLDMDGDGEWYRPGEPGLAGWKIRLDDGRVTTTDSEGYYAFEGLKERTYVVREVCPEGWVQTAPGFTDAAGCGSETHTAAVSSKHPEVNDLDFGNGRPGLSLVKTCPADVFLGDEVEYAVTVQNTGNVALAGVRVEDALIGVDETVDLAPGESATFPGSYSTAGMQIVAAVAPGQYNLFLPLVMRVAGVGTGTTTNVLVDGVLTNTATATAEYGDAEVTASKSCVTKVHALDVSKDVQPSVTRIYRWTIEKEVDDPGPHLVYVGDFVNVVYTVTVDLDEPPFLEDVRSVQGTIEVTNPAPMDAELASVSDVVSGGIVAAVDCPSLTVPAGGTLVCSYGPVYLPDGGDRVNVATATLNNNDGGTTDFVGTATVSFRSAVVEELDTEVDVTDSMEGFLGTVRYDEVPVHFTYTRMISADGSSGDLIVVDNEVTLVTNDTSTTSTATATVALFEVRTVTLGYEDLPRDQPNDWDYNDLVVDIEPVLEVSPDHDLLAIEFTIRQQLGAGPTGGLTNFVHTFNVQPYADAFSCDGTYRLETTRNGVTTAATGSYQRGDNFVIVPFTATPPDVVKLRIEFDVPVGSGCPFQYSNLDVLGQFHGEWLFFDPWIQPWDTGEEIHLLRPPESEYRILTVPVDWQWPVPDGKHIWDYYPKVKAPDPSKPPEGPIFVPQWWVD